jgi:hypothetical protein
MNIVDNVHETEKLSVEDWQLDYIVGRWIELRWNVRQ